MTRCIRCGGDIIFRYMDGVCTPIHLSGGCGYGSGTYSSAPPPELPGSASHPWLYHGTITFATTCWWCRRRPVYFYRNENGGCALFDDLGPPWPLHQCWRRHLDHRRDATRAFLLGHLEVLRKAESHYPWATHTPPNGAPSLRIKGYLFRTSVKCNVVRSDHHGVYVDCAILSLDQRLHRTLLPISAFPLLEIYPLCVLDCYARRRGNATVYVPRHLALSGRGGVEVASDLSVQADALINDHWHFQTWTYSEIWRELAKHEKRNHDGG